MEDGTRSKTGERDVSIMLDSKWLKWLDPALETLRAGNPELPLWDFDYHLFTREFKKSVTALQSPHVVPYQMRHSGASCDRASRERSQEEVIKRGQWRAATSAARYEKSARLAKSLARHSAAMVAHMRECEQKVEGVLLRGESAPAPPVSR
jgi:hypothetical protein